jgi:competence protein ComGC
MDSRPSRILFPALPLVLALSSLALAAVFVLLTLNGLYRFPLLMLFSVPALFSAVGALSLGVHTLRRRPPGAAYGFAMGGSLLGGFSLVFWMVKIPLIFMILLPAMSHEPEDAQVEASAGQMRILIRQTKSFHRDHGRMPVLLEELVREGYVDNRLLYDPRDTRKDRPSYRLLLREMPPPERWSDSPVLEGRWPDEAGNRLLGYLDEEIGTLR